MAPTIPQNATLLADKISASDAARGDILIVRNDRGEDYVKRLVGLPGDTIEMRGGVIILNGEPVRQRVMGDYSYVAETETFGGPQAQSRQATRLSERLPDMQTPYFVLNESLSYYDEFPAVTLETDEYFFLGDNRDNSADSRASPEDRGLGIVTGDQIIRRVDLSSIER